MPYFKIPYSGYAVVEADSPEGAIKAYEDDDTILEDKTRSAPEWLSAEDFAEIMLEI